MTTPAVSPAQWVAGARPRTLPAAVSPVLAGTGVAAYVDEAVWWKAVLALVVAVALQVGVNYANDYSDGIRGTDADRVGPLRLRGLRGRARRLGEGGSVCRVRGRRGRRARARGDHELVAGAGRCARGGGRVVLHRRLDAVRLPRAGRGDGFRVLGLVAVLGTTYVQIEELPLAGWCAAVGVGALACAILVANNLRDIPTDRVVGKRTLAVVLGDARTRGLYALLLGVALVALMGIVLTTSAFALLGLAFLVPAVPSARLVLTRTTGRDLVPCCSAPACASCSTPSDLCRPLVAHAG